jgi:hypothetical protein
MPTKEEALAERTFKQEGLDVEKRVYYTLCGDSKAPSAEKVQLHRNSKAIGLLFKTLLETGTLTKEQLDEILLEVTW